MDDVIYPFADKGLKSTRHYLNKGLLKITFLVNFVLMHIFIKSPSSNESKEKWFRMSPQKMEPGKIQ